MAKLLPGWFQEFSPTQQIVENKMKEIIKKNYEIYGFANIETPAVELTSVLTSKGGDEVGNQIFGLYGLKQGWEDLKNFSLHFDLTVPFARYVVDRESELKFPFKRYQIQKVWRGERQQRGRFKEFTQCDIDVVGPKVPLQYDSEIISALYFSISEIFAFLNYDKKAQVHMNNKKFISWICEKFAFDAEKSFQFFKLLDDYYKLPKEKFEEILTQIAGDRSSDVKNILSQNIESLDENDANYGEGVRELKEVYFALVNNGVNVVFDPYITRGLDYYTGTVFETFIEGKMDFGSVCSGGRYDNLVDSIKKLANNGKSWPINYLWVGGSIGLSRLFALLESENIVKVLPLSEVIVLNAPGSNLVYMQKVANILRKAGFKTDVYFNEDKLPKQFMYAESKNVQFAVFAWGDEETNGEVVVKNMTERTQENVKIEELVKYLGR